MNKEGNSLVEEYKALADKSANPALTAEAKSAAQNEAQKKFEAIQNKQREVQPSFRTPATPSSSGCRRTRR
jgi:outer membrane protein